MKASEWEIEDAINEDIPIYDNHVPKKFITHNSKLVGMEFEKVEAKFDELPEDDLQWEGGDQKDKQLVQEKGNNTLSALLNDLK